MLACLGTRAVPSLSVVIPAYNERERLPATLDASLACLHRADRDWELIVVDDGSDDGTAAWVAAQQPAEPRLRLFRAKQNCGKGAALAAGAQHARGSRVLFMDADNGTPITALPSLEAMMDAEACDVVVGLRGGDAQRSWHRRLMGAVFVALTATCVAGVPDTQCGFKLLRRQAVAATMPHLRLRRWAYDVELLFLAQTLGLRVASCPVPSADVAGSKITWRTPAEMLWDVVRVSVLYRTRVWPLPKEDTVHAVQAGSQFAEVRPRETHMAMGMDMGGDDSSSA